MDRATSSPARMPVSIISRMMASSGRWWNGSSTRNVGLVQVHDQGAQLGVAQRRDHALPVYRPLDAPERIGLQSAGGDDPDGEAPHRLVPGPHRAGRAAGVEQVAIQVCSVVLTIGAT